ncbi:MAG: hypothetical protein RBU37_05555 [Myxococcota bacterium]|jgi:hypothetical protein|nr:hypothetical protein [Myxococcota bacterium]
MSERGSRKIPVTERQFLWVQDDDKGEVVLHVGPTMVSPTAADRIVVSDGQGGFIEASIWQPQRMVELSDGQYAVLYNPLLDRRPEEGPNGNFKAARNESRPLANGTRSMIPGPCSFYLRPGQEVEIRDAHELASNQYLVVKCYGEVDKDAPYYRVTALSAGITTATAEEVHGDAQLALSAREERELQRGQLIVIRGLDTQFYIPPTGVDVVPDLSVGEGVTLSAEAARQLLSKTAEPTPPSEPEPKEGSAFFASSEEREAKPRPKAKAAPWQSAKGGGAPAGAGSQSQSFNAAQELQEKEDDFGDCEAEESAIEIDELMDEPTPKKRFKKERRQELRSRRERDDSDAPIPPPAASPMPSPSLGLSARPPMPVSASSPRAPADLLRGGSGFDLPPSPQGATAPPDWAVGGKAPAAPSKPAEHQGELPELSQDDLQGLLGSEVHRRALEREVRKARLVRQAVVLSEKQFCVLIDADGKRQIKHGPARVFPGPYDLFLTQGASERIYNAYELLAQRALWLRFVAPISREQLKEKLPLGIKLEQEQYLPGDALLLSGVNTFFFPFIEAEILHPHSGLPHIGNDHSEVFVETIGIDQKSGIYVRDLASGEVRLIRGKQSYLVDPRHEVQVTRTVSAEDWNLWIGAVEPHKRRNVAVTTPWAISINIPHNTAVLVASGSGERVVEGPCVEILGYDERLVSLSLSTGVPKDDAQPLQTCYLRTVGNVVSDEVQLESADYVALEVRLSYRLSMDRNHRDKWFNHPDYVGTLCEHLRSLLRQHFRRHKLMELWPRLPDLIRDAILSERTESGQRGRFFPDVGLWLHDVEVLESSILDDEIGELLGTLQRDSVTRQIDDRREHDRFRSETLLHSIELERLQLRRQMQEKQAELDERLRELRLGASLQQLRLRELSAKEQAELTAKREEAVLRAQLDRDELAFASQLDHWKQDLLAKLELSAQEQAQQAQHQALLNALEIALLEAQAQATVAERRAVQPALVEALTALGDQLLLGEVAANMNLVSLFKGKDMSSILKEILGASKVTRSLD